MLLGKVIWIRFHYGLGDFCMFSGVPLTDSIVLFLHDLTFNVPLLRNQPVLAHDLFVKDGSFLLETRFEEPLTHHLNNLVYNISLQASEFDPFTGEAWSHFNSMLQI